MATEFTMPKLGLTMEAGTIVQWLVPDGAEVREGDAVVLIETDKVESDVVASASGILARTGTEGTTYECGARIGWFLAAGESAPAETTAAPAVAAAAAPVAAAPRLAAAPAVVANRAADGRLLASPNAKRVAKELGVDLATVAGTGPGGRIVSEDVEAAARNRPAAPAAAVAPAAVPAAPRPSGVPTLATFAARRLADELGLDLSTVAPRSVDPRVSRDDVVAHVRDLLAAATTPAAPATPAAAPTAPLLQDPTRVIPLRGMRGTIARRMHDSLQQMAQLTLFMDVAMDRVVADREARRAAGAAPGYTDYVVAAVARALVAHPVLNSQVTAEGVALLPQVNVGVAVALDEGLLVPVVHDTPARDLASLAAETSRLATAARSGTLTLDELAGGTFSVTALGMYGVDGFTPVINSPNTAILGVGRLREETAWDGDTPRRTSVLTLSLTWDHRAFDGAPAADFVRTVKRHLEEMDLS